MEFVRMEDLRVGMRLARPIYNKKGVMLFERDTKLTLQGIESVKNFGLLGMYILDPAEPLPPMSEEDMESERFQITTGSSIQEELEKLRNTQKQTKIESIASMIIRKYGHLEGKITLYQNLRSQDDFISRHSLNVATLCAMITHVMNVRLEEQSLTVQAALVHDMGKQSVPNNLLYAKEQSEEIRKEIREKQLAGLDIVEQAFGNGNAIKRICNQAARVQQDRENGTDSALSGKMVTGAKILLVANRYDEMTAMNLQGEAESEVQALREFEQYPGIYDPEVVAALIKSVNILFPGNSVELNTGEKALVLSENPRNVLRPTVLTFSDNSILDLSLAENRDFSVVDIVKTLDNRHIMSAT
ncbi:MAG: HD-GYP domain-containing protein [Acetatifactor sp.]